ncbi:MAG TPA: metallophosphoesterase [Stellaceae bacterium]|nr:metallophosphoesterase [Stellaceae bacterium]
MDQGNAGSAPGTARRQVLKCMVWAGTGVLWTVSGGVPRSLRLGGEAFAATGGDFNFVQISDSHLGFNKDPNPDSSATLQQALAEIGRLPQRPAMVLHTGDVTHLSKPEQFDTAAQILKTANLDTHFVPGEHDVLVDDGKPFFERFGTAGSTGGWYSFDQGGVHFVGLVNVLNLRPGGLGYLGTPQIEWLEADLKGRSASTPIVVFSHMPMWSVYPEWGWGTDDAAQALSYLKRFGSVTVLNGHIHQVLQKVEGNVAFHTARSTSFPQATPGDPVGPGPWKVPADRLKSMLGIREITLVPGKDSLALVEQPLGA